MKPKVAFFLPVRNGSERVINKNYKTFAGVEVGLLKLKLLQLFDVVNLDEIILSTNCEKCIEIAESLSNSDKRLKIVRRPEYLCQSYTDLQDLIKYVPTITNAEHILWGHVTTPFADHNDYNLAIDTYLKQLVYGFDSLISVQKLQNYIYNYKFELINNPTILPWPRTQDLDCCYELNHAMFITRRETYLKSSNRCGVNPYLFSMGKINSIDIDTMEDFYIAEMLYGVSRSKSG